MSQFLCLTSTVTQSLDLVEDTQAMPTPLDVVELDELESQCTHANVEEPSAGSRKPRVDIDDADAASVSEINVASAVASGSAQSPPNDSNEAIPVSNSHIRTNMQPDSCETSDDSLGSIKITGSRLLITVVTTAFGSSKAVLSYQGHSVAPTTLEWVFGVVLSLG